MLRLLVDRRQFVKSFQIGDDGVVVVVDDGHFIVSLGDLELIVQEQIANDVSARWLRSVYAGGHFASSKLINLGRLS